MSYFQYIKKHEAYIAEQIGKGTQNVKKHPHTKRGKKEKCASERRRRCQQIAHVQGLLEELEEG